MYICLRNNNVHITSTLWVHERIRVILKSPAPQTALTSFKVSMVKLGTAQHRRRKAHVWEDLGSPQRIIQRRKPALKVHTACLGFLETNHRISLLHTFIGG